MAEARESQELCNMAAATQQRPARPQLPMIGGQDVIVSGLNRTVEEKYLCAYFVHLDVDPNIIHRF